MLAERLKELRKKEGKTQGEFAKKLGIARSTYSGYERGTSEPDNETLMKLSALYNCSIDYLMGRTQTPQLSAKEQAEAFLESLDLDLADREILDKFNFNVDGVPLTETQIKKFISYVRIERATDN